MGTVWNHEHGLESSATQSEKLTSLSVIDLKNARHCPDDDDCKAVDAGCNGGDPVFGAGGLFSRYFFERPSPNKFTPIFARTDIYEYQKAVADNFCNFRVTFGYITPALV